MATIIRRLSLSHIAFAALPLLAMGAAACGGGASAKSAASPSAAASVSTSGGRRGGGGFRGTVSPDMQTAFAEGTRPAFGNRTPPPEAQTAIAQGTPAASLFGGSRTPSAAVQTAIAEGTPAASLRFGFGGNARAINAAALVLGIDQQQLRTELQAQGASLESVAAAHGIDRATLRQKLIDAVRAQLAQAVANGMLQQSDADQAETAFESNIDSLIDRVGADNAFQDASPTP